MRGTVNRLFEREAEYQEFVKKAQNELYVQHTVSEVVSRQGKTYINVELVLSGDLVEIKTMYGDAEITCSNSLIDQHMTK